MTDHQWNVLPLKALYRRRETTGRPELPLLSVYRDLGVVAREGRDDNWNKPGDDLSAYRVVRPGDLVLNKMKTWQGSLGVSAMEGIVSPAYFVCKQVARGEPRFLHHLLRSQPLINEYGKRSKGIRPSQWDLPWDEFREIKVQIPPLVTQRAIADYLDAETARIDALIEKKRRMVELLREKRIALISEAVGYKIANRSYSGIQNGEGVRLRYIATINPPTPEFVLLASHAEIPFIPLEAVCFGNRLDVSRRRPKFAVETGYTRFREQDILVPKITPTFQANRTVIAEGLEGGIAAGTTELHVVRVKPDADRRYVRYLLSSKSFLDEGEASMIGVAGQKRVPDEYLRNLIVPVVEIDQQRAIADYLDAETTHIDALIARYTRTADLLAEYRKALITSIVTGETAVPLPDEELMAA